MNRHWPRLAAAIAVALGFGLRLPCAEPAAAAPRNNCGPPGLYRDEAANGLDALRVIQGERPLYFAANNGREPIYIYSAAASVGVLGRSPAAVRLPAAFYGALAVAAVFALGRLLIGSGGAVVAAALMAVAPWPVILGRLGLRAGTLVAVMALAGAAALVAAGRLEAGRPGLIRWAAFAGFLAGLTMYTYTAARVAWAVPLLVGGWLAVTRRVDGRGPIARPVLVWWAALALTVLPLVSAALLEPEVVLGRPGQVAAVEPGATPGELAAAIDQGLRGAVGLFLSTGDWNPRHNLPGRPLFAAPAAAAAFGLGFAYLVAVLILPRFRRRLPPASAILILAWLGVMLVPTALAEDAPHFLRAVGVLPAAVITAGAGVVALGRGLGQWVGGRRSRAGRLIGRAVVAVAAAFAVLGEFGDSLDYIGGGVPAVTEAPLAVARLPLTHAFEAGALALALDVNQTRASGWRGGWTGSPPTEAATRVWLDRRLRDGWPAIEYLVPDTAVTLVDPYDPVLEGPGVAFLWPHAIDQAEVWSALSGQLAVTIDTGSEVQGDLEPEPSLLYIRVVGAAAPPDFAPPMAVFGNGLELLAARAVSSHGDRTTELTTAWKVGARPAEDPVLFAQVQRGGRLVATSDQPLGFVRVVGPDRRELYRGVPLAPTHWPVGLTFEDKRRLDLPVAADLPLVIGLYVGPEAVPIDFVDADGMPGERLNVPIELP